MSELTKLSKFEWERIEKPIDDPILEKLRDVMINYGQGGKSEIALEPLKVCGD